MNPRAGKSDFYVKRKGLACRNGKLYEFTGRHVLVMKGWPDPQAWFKRRSHGWIHTRKWADKLFTPSLFPADTKAPPKPERRSVLPDGQMMLPNMMSWEEWAARAEYSNYTARAAFFNQIPDEIRAELLKYGSRRWHLLNVFARCPGSLDLSRSNPALLFALANNWVFHKPAVQKPLRAARSLVWQKQKTILKWLGFPPREPVRRLLSKISADSVDVETLLYLRRALKKSDCLKLLSHLPKLNKDAIMMAADRRFADRVTPSLLREVIQPSDPKTTAEDATEAKPEKGEYYWLMLDTMRMVRIANWAGCPRKFHSIKRMKAVHDELSARMEYAMLSKERSLPDRFEEPPFPGTEFIIPITTPRDLLQEGVSQKHCVGSYIYDIITGNEYVYRVEKPVRATLSIIRRGKRWVLSQCRAACNQAVAPKIILALKRELFSSKYGAAALLKEFAPVPAQPARSGMGA